MMRRTFLSSCLIVSLLCTAPLGARAADAPLADAVQQLDRATIRSLLEGSANVNASQVDGMTALLWAAYHDEVEIVGELVRAGADVQASNRYGVTPLSLACTNGNVAMVERLLRPAPTPTRRCRAGRPC